MTERPILFSAPMIRALLNCTKSQTRRAVKGKALEWLESAGFTPTFTADPANGLCPYGVPGDRLWVKETFFAFGRWETRFNAKKGRDEWHFVDMTLEAGKAYQYAEAGEPVGYNKAARAGATPSWWKRPAIFMPRAACRITLEVTGVRVERLQDISEADAAAEGIDRAPSLGTPGDFQWCDYRVPNDSAEWFNSPVRSYETLWEQINGPGNWAANPWVWAVSFKRLAADDGGGR